MARGRNGQEIPRLHVHCIVMRERRDSTNSRIADGTDAIRNIGVKYDRTILPSV
ncbi:MAG: hypothetical protein J6J06_03125 [Bacteroidaceae bacterium]|nr:hypothetical protein [Bacteroidaceae bacterium]